MKKKIKKILMFIAIASLLPLSILAIIGIDKPLDWVLDLRI